MMEGVSGTEVVERAENLFSTEDSQARTSLVLNCRGAAAPRRTTAVSMQGLPSVEGCSPAAAGRTVDVHLLYCVRTQRGEAAVGDFFDFENLMNHLHGALNHFPIALLFVSAGLDFVAWKRPNLRSSAWLLLVLGTLGAIAATVSGLLAHLAYEDDPYLLSAM